MAKKQILSGLFVDVLQDADKLKTTIKGVKTELSDIAKIESKKLLEIDEKTLKGIQQLEESLRKLNGLKQASQQIVKTEKKILIEENKVRKQLQETTDEEVKAKIRYSKALSEQRAKMKALVDLEQAEKNSLNELTIKNRILQQERKHLNFETEEGQKRLKEINSELDDNNRKIKENVDLMTKQRMNVGNYREDIEKAIGELTQGNAVLGVFVQGWDTFNSALESSKDTFENLKNEFALVRASIMANITSTNANTSSIALNTEATAVNTTATVVNTETTAVNTTATAVNTSWLRRHFVALNLNTRAIWRMVTSAKALKIALASTGIGLLIVSLTGLVGLFSQGISGSLRMEKVMKGLGAGLNTTFSGLTQVAAGFILKLSTIGESWSLTLDEWSFKIDSLTMSSEERYKKLQELNKRQEELDVKQANANIKLQDGLKNLNKISENSAKAVEGALVSLQRRLETLKIDVALSKMSKDFQKFSEIAEDDTHSFGTRMASYTLSMKIHTEMLTEQMKKNILEYQSGLGDIVKRFSESSEMLTDKQQQLYNSAKKLMSVDITGLNDAQLKERSKDVYNLTKQISNYLASVPKDKLESDLFAIDENEVKKLIETYNEISDIEKEYTSTIITNKERERKALQDMYEAEADLRETFVLRLKDIYTQQANDENITYNNRLKALDRFRYASEMALKDNVKSINKLFTDLYESQTKQDALLGVTTSAKRLKTELVQIGKELKLFVNGVELNQDVFQGEFLKGLTSENAEKSVLFLRPLADLINGVNMANIELKKSNYALAKSYDDLNLEINENNRLLEVKRNAHDENIRMNEELLKNNRLVFMSDRELALFRENQTIKQANQDIKLAEVEYQNSLNRLGQKRKELEQLKEMLIEENELRKQSLQNRINAETDTKQKEKLQKELDDLKDFHVQDVESFKKKENEVLQAQEDTSEKKLNLSNKYVALAESNRDKEFRILKERADMLTDIASGVDKFEQMMFDRKMSRLDREYEKSKNHEARLLEAKKMGSEQATESIALEIARQEKIQLKKEKLERRKQRTELVTAGLKAYASNVEKGNPNPLQKTFTDTVALTQFLKEIPLFWEGAERVGDKLGKPHLNEKRDNYLVRVDGGERVMTNDQNSKLGNISNDELADVGKKWNSGLLMDMTKLNFRNNVLLVKPETKNTFNENLLNDIKNELKDLPNKMPISRFEYDEVNRMTVDILKKGSNVYKTRSRIK